MTLDDTHYKGKWKDDSVITFIVKKEKNRVTRSEQNLPNIIQNDIFSVLDRKNWSYSIENSTEIIHATDGIISHENLNQNAKQQVTRLQWLQNILLEKISS